MKIKLQLIGAALCLVLAGSLYAQQGKISVTGNVNEAGQIGAPTFAVSTISLPGTVVGATYSQQLGTVNGVGSVTWAYTGTLPSGLTLPNTGLISGAVGNNPGNYAITVTATDSNSDVATQPLIIAVGCPTMNLTGPANWPPGDVGLGYSYTLPLSGGYGPFNFVASNLPPGESMASSTGATTGTPSTGGSYPSIAVTVTDSCPLGQQTVNGSYTEQVNAQLAITTPPQLSPATYEAPYSVQIAEAGGTGPFAWSVSAGTLPQGLALGPSTGAITGTPTGVGLSTFSITVTDHLGATATLQNATINVSCVPLSFSTPDLPNGNQNQPYSFQEATQGGFGTITFGASGLPQGINASTSGLVSGTTSLFGTFTPTISASDQCPVQQNTSINPTLIIAQQLQPPVITTTSPLPGAIQNQNYSQQLQASNGTTPYSWAITAGALPSGITMTTGGLVAGSPSATGTFLFTVQVTDANKLQSTPVQFSLTVAPNSGGTLTITNTSPLPGCTVNQPCSIQFGATGGTPPYAWSIPGGGGSANWAQAFTNPSQCPYIHGFAIRITNNEWYIACHTNAVAMKSTNQGATWTNITPSQITSGQIWSIQVNPNDGSLVLQNQGGTGIGGKTYISTNDGSSWSLDQPIGWTGVQAGSHSGCALPLTSTSPDVMVCGSYNFQQNLGPWYSTNNGPNAAIATSYTGGNNQSSYGLGINPADNCFFNGGEASGTFRSCNGHDWTLVFACISSCVGGTNGNVTSFAFDSAGNAFEAAQGGVYEGTKASNWTTWNKVFSGGGQANAMYADTSGNLYVNISPNGAHTEYISTNDGGNWNAWDTGLPAGDLTGAFPVQNPNDGKLYSLFFNDSGNSGSIYSTPLGPSSLPPGMTLNSAGLLSGTPSATGTYTFTVKVNDSASHTASGSFTITIGSTMGPLTITSTSPLPNVIVGQPANIGMQATGGVPFYTWTQTSGSLPTGLVLGSNGQITGTATAPGTTTANIEVTDQEPKTVGPQAFNITAVCPVQQITTTSLPPATQNVQYSTTVQGTGGYGTITWGATGLPTGFTMGSSTGTISGTTSQTGTFTVTVTRQDQCSASPISVKFQLQVNASSLAITTPSLPAATVGQAYSATISGAGGVPPYTWSETGTLPTGVTWNATTATISGTPGANTAGSYPITITLTDSVPNSVSANFTLTVNAATGADNRDCSPSETWTGPTMDGPSNAPQSCVRTATTDTPSPGSTVTVTAGSCSSLQSAINGAVAGETIIIPSQTTPGSGVKDVFTSCTIKPAAAGNAANWITVRTDVPQSLSPEGTRISPAFVGIGSLPGRPPYTQPSGGPGIFMPEILANGNFTVQLQGTMAYWRFEGIQFSSPAGSSAAQIISGSCNHCVFDRDIIQGGNNALGQSTDSIQAGMNFYICTYCAVIDSYLFDFHCVSVCSQSQGIEIGGNATAPGGPIKLVNDFIEGAGENIFSGGGGAAPPTVIYPVTDVEIRRNDISKPAFWYAHDPSYFGHLFELDNLMEMKNAKRVWVEANFWNLSVWQGSQQGNAFIFSGRNQSTNCCTGTANADTSGNVTWVSGGKFTNAMISQYCAVAFHCQFKLAGTVYTVSTFVSATQITITPSPSAAITNGAFTGAAPGLNPNAVADDGIFFHNFFTHIDRVGAIASTPSDNGDVPKETLRFSFHDNIAEDVDGWTFAGAAGACCVWGTGLELIPSNSSVFPDFVSVQHNLFIQFLGGTCSSTPGCAQGSGPGAFFWGMSEKKLMTSFVATDNIIAGGIGANASEPNAEAFITNAVTGTSALCFDHNAFITKTNPMGPNNKGNFNTNNNPPYPVAADSGKCTFQPTGNLQWTDYTTPQFVNLNNGVGGDYHLQASSPGHLAGSDGKDLGPDVSGLDAAIAGVQ